jgi:hypothetical protein
MGTRFVQITVGGWDNHVSIYSTLNPANANSLGRQFDSAMGTLIADLRTDGLLDETLVIAMGEFGRTVGALNSRAGRDHLMQQAVMLAGAKVRGRRIIGGRTSGANTAEAVARTISGRKTSGDDFQPGNQLGNHAARRSAGAGVRLHSIRVEPGPVRPGSRTLELGAPGFRRCVAKLNPAAGHRQ